MHHITISTTGIFNAIRPSLFPPIEGKETTTFLLGLDFNTGGIIPFYDEEQDDVVVNGPHVELERQRIRARSSRPCVRRWASPLRSVAVRSYFPCQNLSAMVRITGNLY